MDHSEKLKLYGFNNLTKALSFNIYDVCYAKTPREQKDYIAYIDQPVSYTHLDVYKRQEKSSSLSINSLV